MSNNRDSYLVSLITDAKRLAREAVRRRKVFDEKSIPAEVIAEHEAEGWQVDRKRKRKTLLEDGVFIDKNKFKERGYLGSGGIGRFRNSLWAVVVSKKGITNTTKPDEVEALANKNRRLVFSKLGKMSTNAY